jgi:hypothetical protein
MAEILLREANVTSTELEKRDGANPLECTRAVTGGRSAAETSCEAASRVKPKVRLCEPWVTVSHMLRAAERRQR